MITLPPGELKDSCLIIQRIQNSFITFQTSHPQRRRKIVSHRSYIFDRVGGVWIQHHTNGPQNNYNLYRIFNLFTEFYEIFYSTCSFRHKTKSECHNLIHKFYFKTNKIFLNKKNKHVSHFMHISNLPACLQLNYRHRLNQIYWKDQSYFNLLFCFNMYLYVYHV